MVERGDIRQFQSTAVEQNNAGQVIEGITDTVFSLGQKVAYMKGQEIKSQVAAQSSLANIEMYKTSENLRQKYLSDPTSSKFVEEKKQAYAQIKQKYGQQFSSLGYRQWDSAFNELSTGYAMKDDVWAFKQQKDNVITNLGTSIENDVIMSRTAGATGDFATFATTLDANYNNFYQTAVGALGVDKANKLMQTYKADNTTSFVGSMLMTNPDGAMELLNDKQVQELINDPVNVEKLKDAARTQRTKIYQEQEVDKAYNIVKNQGDFGVKILQQGASFSEMEIFFQKNPDLTDADKSAIAKMAGFSYTPKEGKNLGKPQEPKLLKTDKLQAFSELLNQGSAMVSMEYFNTKEFDIAKQDPKNLDVKQSRTAKMLKSVNDYQRRVIEHYNAGVITQAQMTELVSNYALPVSNYLRVNTRQLEEKSGWAGEMLGYSQVKKFADDLENDENLSQADIDIEKGLVYSQYYKELVKYSKGNVYAIEQMDSAEQRKIYSTASKNAITFAKNNSRNPAVWFKSDYPAQAQVISSILPKGQATKAMTNVSNKLQANPNADVNKVVNDEITNSLMEQPKQAPIKVGKYTVKVK